MAKIVVIDDEIHVQRLIKIILDQQGHQVITASSGEEGVALIDAEAEAPDLILLDLMMPGVGGLQVLRTLKENPKTATVPVVLLTAVAQENVVLQGIKLGAKDYVRKPFHPQELAKRVGKQLGS